LVDAAEEFDRCKVESPQLASQRLNAPFPQQGCEYLLGCWEPLVCHLVTVVRSGRDPLGRQTVAIKPTRRTVWSWSRSIEDIQTSPSRWEGEIALGK
jgi:hypothetical protein